MPIFLTDTCLVSKEEKYHVYSCALRPYLIQTEPRMILHKSTDLIALTLHVPTPGATCRVPSCHPQDRGLLGVYHYLSWTFNSGYSGGNDTKSDYWFSFQYFLLCYPMRFLNKICTFLQEYSVSLTHSADIYWMNSSSKLWGCRGEEERQGSCPYEVYCS